MHVSIDGQKITFQRDLDDLSCDMNGLDTAKRGPTQIIEVRGGESWGIGDSSSKRTAGTLFGNKLITIEVLKANGVVSKALIPLQRS